MRSISSYALALTLAAAPAAAFAQAAPEAPATAEMASAHAPAHYSTENTDIGTLLDDPAARAVLAEHIPEMLESDQIDQARSMTLKEIQPYAQEMFSDLILAKVDEDFAKLHAKH